MGTVLTGELDIRIVFFEAKPQLRLQSGSEEGELSNALSMSLGLKPPRLHVACGLVCYRHAKHCWCKAGH